MGATLSLKTIRECVEMLENNRVEPRTPIRTYSPSEKAAVESWLGTTLPTGDDVRLGVRFIELKPIKW